MSDDAIQDLYRQLSELRKWKDAQSSVELPRFIGARYSTNAGQTINNNTNTVVNYEDLVYDPLSLVTTGAGWVFTCPLTGYYAVRAAVCFNVSANWNAGEVAEIDLYRSGVRVSVLDRQDTWIAGANLYAFCQGGDIISCTAGDTIQIQTYQSTGANLALLNSPEYNYVSIARVG